jgi:SpoVK/Ycf46/Vps4 family AAA+-type ATPase
MARADLLKKLFSSFKTDDKDSFLKIADDIIDDERKKNHSILADELKTIISNGSAQTKRTVSTYSASISRDKDPEKTLFEIIFPEQYLADVVISQYMRQQIEQIIKEFLNWDVLISNGVYPIRRVLFYGPPGCGKTLTAKVIASEMGLPLLYVRFDAIISSYLGETASNIRKVFDYAKNNSFVILFDEFDAIARSRNDSYEHGEIKRVVNAFLQQLDNFKGKSLVVAATNFEDSLDYAIWRRFDNTLQFSMPNNEERIKLFLVKLKQFDGPKHVISEYIGHMTNFAYSDIEQAANMVMKQCILEGKRIYTKRDIEQSIHRQEEIVLLRKTHY